MYMYIVSVRHVCSNAAVHKLLAITQVTRLASQYSQLMLAVQASLARGRRTALCRAKVNEQQNSATKQENRKLAEKITSGKLKRDIRLGYKDEHNRKILQNTAKAATCATIMPVLCWSCSMFASRAQSELRTGILFLFLSLRWRCATYTDIS